MIISGGGGASAPELAPHLTFFSSKVNGLLPVVVSGVDASAALTEVLGLTGKFLVMQLGLQSLTANDVTDIKLVIDGVVIWDESGMASNSTTEPLIGVSSSNTLEAYVVNDSLSLQIKTAVDVSIDVVYIIRPMK